MKSLNVIIYYDNPIEIREYITNCIRNSDNVDIAIVINSDKDGAAASVLDAFVKPNGRVRVYDFHENVGYLNSLLKISENDEMDKYGYYILSNTDISYETPNFYGKLASNKYDSRIGCIAPSIYSNRSCSFSNPHYKNRIIKAKYMFLSTIFTFPTIGRLYLQLAGLKSKSNNGVAEEESGYVYSPHGCFMIFTKNFMKSIKGYLYGVTLYSEEACIGELLIKNNMRCYFDKTIRVHHDESTVTGKINYKKRFEYWKKSIDYILKEFYKR